MVAGMIELLGGKITFHEARQDASAQLTANLGEGRQEIVVAVAQGPAAETSFVIPEPVASARVFGVAPVVACESATAAYAVFDLTDVPRQRFGGFSVVAAETRPDGRLKVSGQRNLVAPVRNLANLAA